MKYQQKSFSVSQYLPPASRTLCPRCAFIGPTQDRIIWRLCPQHRSELPGEPAQA